MLTDTKYVICHTVPNKSFYSLTSISIFPSTFIRPCQIAIIFIFWPYLSSSPLLLLYGNFLFLPYSNSFCLFRALIFYLFIRLNLVLYSLQALCAFFNHVCFHLFSVYRYSFNYNIFSFLFPYPLIYFIFSLTFSFSSCISYFLFSFPSLLLILLL